MSFVVTGDIISIPVLAPIGADVSSHAYLSFFAFLLARGGAVG
jgi:hypothetical protein